MLLAINQIKQESVKKYINGRQYKQGHDGDYVIV